MEPGDGRQYKHSSKDRTGNDFGETDSKPQVVAKTDGGKTNGSLPSVSLDEFTSLSGFQRDILFVISGLETPKGLEIKDGLEKIYRGEINNGRLYPNLDTLAEEGLIDKIELDGRSNGYELTQTGRASLLTRQQWMQEQMPQNDYTQSIEAVNAPEKPDEDKKPSDDTSDAESSQPQKDASHLRVQQQLENDLEKLSRDSTEDQE
jgi:DNA-binding PadR family transcriptional regulator